MPHQLWFKCSKLACTIVYRMKKIISLLVIGLLLQTAPGAAQEKTSNYLPIIFVHGMLASGDTWAVQCQRFIQQGYTAGYLQVLDWNTLSFGSKNDVLLDSLINKTLQQTGATQVNLVGHSAGGGVCNSYLQNPAQAKKVAHYVHIGSGKINQLPTVPVLNIYSPDDKVTGGSDIKGAENLSLPGADHYEVATSLSTFEALYRFFNQQQPNQSVSKQKKSSTVQLAGRIVGFGTNIPVANASLRISEYNPVTGDISANPVFTTTSDSLGFWSGCNAKTDKYYEMKVTPTDPKSRVIYYYFEPFQSNNYWLYLRTLSSNGMSAMLTGNFPKNDTQSVVTIFSAQKSILHGRDSLTINHIPLNTAELASPAKTAIAFFVYQNNSPANKAMNNFPFISTFNTSLPADSNIDLYCNGRNRRIKSIPSSKGVMVVVFN